MLLLVWIPVTDICFFIWCSDPPHNIGICINKHWTWENHHNLKSAWQARISEMPHFRICWQNKMGKHLTIKHPAGKMCLSLLPQRRHYKRWQEHLESSQRDKWCNRHRFRIHYTDTHTHLCVCVSVCAGVYGSKVTTFLLKLLYSQKIFMYRCQYILAYILLHNM